MAVGFPADVFPAAIRQNFQTISEHENIPLDFLYSSALYTIAALSGNVYNLIIKGRSVKPILYVALISHSGIGKSPAYNIICGDVVRPFRASENERFKEDYQAWLKRRDEAKKHKQYFDEPMPVEIIRIIEDGTAEAFAKYAEHSAAGFGVFYDEGEQMFTGANAYKKDTSSVGFWNQIYNGKTFQIIRVEAERNRFIRSPAISLLIGMQKDRVVRYFTEDVIKSGLFNRFLLCESDYILLNSNVEMFSERSRVCDEWYTLVKSLFYKGIRFVEGESINIPVIPKAASQLNRIASDLVTRTNKDIQAAKTGDVTTLMLQYESKLFAYLPKFAMILAILDDNAAPVIRQAHIDNALQVYEYYRRSAMKILTRISDQENTGLSASEKELFDELPNHFTASDAERICEGLSLNSKYFLNSFRRKLSKGWIYKNGDGSYKKS